VCFTGFHHDSDLPDAPHDPRRLNVHHDRHIADDPEYPIDRVHRGKRTRLKPATSQRKPIAELFS
jgi:hypothetical protein